MNGCITIVQALSAGCYPRQMTAKREQISLRKNEKNGTKQSLNDARCGVGREFVALWYESSD